MSLAIIDISEKGIDIDMFKIKGGHLYFVLPKNITIGNYAIGAVSPYNVINAVDALKVHSDSLDAIGDFTTHWVTLQPTHLLEVSELRYLHSI